jgi:hypothetical protein
MKTRLLPWYEAAFIVVSSAILLTFVGYLALALRLHLKS